MATFDGADNGCLDSGIQVTAQALALEVLSLKEVDPLPLFPSLLVVCLEGIAKLHYYVL